MLNIIMYVDKMRSCGVNLYETIPSYVIGGNMAALLLFLPIRSSISHIKPEPILV